MNDCDRSPDWLKIWVDYSFRDEKLGLLLYGSENGTVVTHTRHKIARHKPLQSIHQLTAPSRMSLDSRLMGYSTSSQHLFGKALFGYNS